MARRAERGRSEPRYSLRFATAAVILISGTLVLVLYVLPERYVLSPGFRESGMTFPTPATPFAPYPAVAVPARPLPQPPGPPAFILPGPAEAFWNEVVPLLEAGRYDDAVPVFDRYLLEYPADADARRELALTLLAAGQPAVAVGELRRLLTSVESEDQRLLLARTLRELGRTDEAAAEYERLSQARPDDISLILEWAQAYAWVTRYREAADVLERGLAGHPSSAPLRVELARVYFSSGRLEDARAVLAPVPDDVLAAAGGLVLRADILAALYVPPPPPPPPLTPLELAVAAREADDFGRARALFESALRDSPEDAGLWQGYADLLEYELSDFEGARSALLQVERLGGPRSDLTLRLAQLEIWTERTADAERRLTGLLGTLEEDGTSAMRAEVLAMLGDLRRWEGDRPGAGRQYEAALRVDPVNQRARAGLDVLESDVTRQLVEVEAPRLGGSAYSLADTDDFGRVDLGAEWVDVGGPWVAGGTVGNRWVSGVALDGSNADRTGTYVELEGARWWRWGTIRTAVDVGLQRIRSVWDVSAGGSISHRGPDGSTSEVRYERGPAYPIAVTMQSVLADVVQDHVTVSHARPLGERWSVSGSVDGAWLRANQDSVAGSARGTGRLVGALSLGRSLSPEWTIGLASRALGFTRAAPVTSLPGGGTLRLFWDPRLVVTAGPYAQITRDLSLAWRLTGRLGPGVALIDERGPGAAAWVPHVSAEVGLRREGQRFWTALDLFYYQGQFDGYRTYGARFTLSARDYSSLVRP